MPAQGSDSDSPHESWGWVDGGTQHCLNPRCVGWQCPSPGPHLPHPKQLQGGKSTSSGALQSVPHLQPHWPSSSLQSLQWVSRWQPAGPSDSNAAMLLLCLKVFPRLLATPRGKPGQPHSPPTLLDLAQSVPELEPGDPSGAITALRSLPAHAIHTSLPAGWCCCLGS